MNRDNIIILKADKGGTVVIMNTNDYIEEGNTQLNNTEFYTSVDTDPTQAKTELINTRICEGQINSNTNLATIKKSLEKNWNILSINNEKPIIAYKRNKNLRELMGQVHLSNDKLIKSGRRNIMKVYCKPCLPKLNNHCCNQQDNCLTYTIN